MVSYRKMRASFGAYAQVHESADRTKTTNPRTVGAIVLGMSESRSSYYEFMNLNTGKLLLRKNFTILPITDTVVACVEEIAKHRRLPHI